MTAPDVLRQRIATALGQAPDARAVNRALAVVAAERAAELRAAADLIASNVTCGCGTCRARRDIADMLRSRADGIAL